MTLAVDTPAGRARAHLWAPSGGVPLAAVALGHGAGGGVDAPDLVAVRDALLDAGAAVLLVEQPYRVAGRRAPAPAGQLDAAFAAVVRGLRPKLQPAPEVPLVVGGRSAGARVACRTAGTLGAAMVLCLAFPLHPPGRPDRSRAGELDLPQVPVHVLQGERDPFGGPAEFPPAGARLQVHPLPGADHSLRSATAAVATLAVELVQALAAAGAGAATPSA